LWRWRVRLSLSPELERLRQRLAQRPPATTNFPDPSWAAVAVVLTQRPLEVLLIQRAERGGDPWSGHIGLPGGRLQSDDSDLLATAVRETREEVGVILDPGSCLGVLDDVTPRTPMPRPVVVRPFVFAVAPKPALAPNAEVAATMWVTLEELRREGIYRDAAIPIRGEQRAFPAYHIGNHVVWGLTERILTPLLDLLS
jgi:8-oxo-dGTP pyrophosphatase MutT (NUDIX family)